jgi:hypothetical protein
MQGCQHSCNIFNEGQVHEQENDTLILDSVTEDGSTTEENHATDGGRPTLNT